MDTTEKEAPRPELISLQAQRAILAELVVHSLNNLKPSHGGGAVMIGARVMPWQTYYKEGLAKCGFTVA